MRKTHYLKTWPEPFNAVWWHRKTFEIRNNDREFKECDTVILQEYDPATTYFSGREITAEIGYFVGYEKWTKCSVSSCGAALKVIAEYNALPD